MILLILCAVLFMVAAAGTQINVNTGRFKSISTVVYAITICSSALLLFFIPARNDRKDMVPISICVETKTESLSSIIDDGRIQFPSEYIAEVKYYKSEENWYTISRTTKVITAIKRR